MASVVHCFTHAQMKGKMEGEELRIELYEDTGLNMQHLSLFSLCFVRVNECKSVFCWCFMMKHLRATALTPLPTLCIAFQFQVAHPESAATDGTHATLVDRGPCFRTDSFSFKSNESDPVHASCLFFLFHSLNGMTTPVSLPDGGWAGWCSNRRRSFYFINGISAL